MRALILGAVGTVVGALVTVVINATQGISPSLDVLLALIVGVPLGLLLFLWGLGVSIQATVMGAVGLIGGLLLVMALRSLQHLQATLDWGPMLLTAFPLGIVLFLWGLGILRPGMLFGGRPGIPRAVSMGILGFLLGALLVIVVRGLQNLDPIWDAGVGIVFVTFFCAGFFVWGIGAFDPKMSEHAETPEGLARLEEKQAQEEVAQAPGILLSSDIWRVAFMTIVALVVVFGIATIPNFLTLQTVGGTDGNVAAVGYTPVQLPFGGPTVMVSQLALFGLFIIWTFISLAVVAGLIGLLMYFLSRQMKATSGEPSVEDRTPPPIVQIVGRIVAAIAAWLRSGLPRLLGQR